MFGRAKHPRRRNAVKTARHRLVAASFIQRQTAIASAPRRRPLYQQQRSGRAAAKTKGDDKSPNIVDDVNCGWCDRAHKRSLHETNKRSSYRSGNVMSAALILTRDGDAKVKADKKAATRARRTEGANHARAQEIESAKSNTRCGAHFS